MHPVKLSSGAETCEVCTAERLYKKVSIVVPSQLSHQIVNVALFQYEQMRPSVLLVCLSGPAFVAAFHKHKKVLPREHVVGQEVNTTSGRVVGKHATNLAGVSEYLGIPYAMPPVGALRWAAPEPFVGTGKVNATTFVRAKFLVRNSKHRADMPFLVSVGFKSASHNADRPGLS